MFSLVCPTTRNDCLTEQHWLSVQWLVLQKLNFFSISKRSFLRVPSLYHNNLRLTSLKPQRTGLTKLPMFFFLSIWCISLPQVVFVFAHKIDDELTAELEEIGVTISQFPLHSSKSASDEQTDEVSNLENINKIDKLNLDVTTLLAYVSALTNGSNFEFADKILAQQSALERSAPVKSMLDKIFEGWRNEHRTLKKKI